MKYKTASGDILEDEGSVKVAGRSAVSGTRVNVHARLAKVHKPLLSASSVLKNAIGTLDGNGGVIFSSRSKPGEILGE